MGEFYLQVVLQYIGDWADYIPIQMQEIHIPAPIPDLVAYMGNNAENAFLYTRKRRTGNNCLNSTTKDTKTNPITPE